MRIATLSKIKNEADIIESFVRYHGKIADAMYFVENGSTDGTLEILCELRKEGYPIVIFDERESEFDELMFINKYAQIILEQQLFDWLVPIDADEFLYAGDKNPREYLREWNADTVYLVNWRTYLWNAESYDSHVFVPDCFGEYRHEKYETYTKVIVPGRYYQEKGLMISKGNHKAEGIDVKTIKEEHIKFAHYPIRSEEQFKTQIAINCIMQLSRARRTPGEAYHWDDMYQIIKEQREMDLREVSLSYSMPEEEYGKCGEIKTCNGKIGHGFGCMPLKYGAFARISAFYNLMCAGEQLARRLCAQEGAGSIGMENVTRKRIVIYGVGRMAQGYLNAINTKKYEIVAYVDSNLVGNETYFCGKLVQDKESIVRQIFDFVVITSGIYFQEIKSGLLEQGIAEEKICFIAEIIKDGWEKTYHCL